MFTQLRPSREKAVNLSESAAQKWLAERGFLLSGGGSGRVVADAYRAPGFAIARLWIDSRRIVRFRSEMDGARVTIVTEGSVIAHEEDRERFDLHRGDAAISNISTADSLTSATPIALIQISLERDFLVRYALRDIAGTRVVRGSQSPVMVLGALVNSTLASMNIMDLSWGHTKIAVEASTAALIALDRVNDQSTGSSGSRVFDAASLLIEQNSGDPLFTVAALAAALRVSERRLQEVFAARGSSPRTAIRRQRLQYALRLIGNYPSVDGPLLSDIARVSGFKSTRSLRDAIQAERKRARIDE